MLNRVDHIVIAVEDLARAQRDFVSLLGRSPSWTSGHPESGTRNVLFRLDNTYLELRSAVADGPAAAKLRKHLELHGEGLYAIALGTEDVDAAARALRDKGISVGQPERGLTQDGPSGAYRRFEEVELPMQETGGIRLLLSQDLSAAGELPPSLPIGDPAAAVHAIDHVVIMTNWPDRARELYGDKLGIRLALDKTFDERGVRLLFFRLGGLTIEIGAQLKEGADLEPPPASADLLWGLAYQVADATLAQARLGDMGVEVTKLRAGHKPGTRVCTASGKPGGVATLIIEPVAKAD